jgi:hypothetical protein
LAERLKALGFARRESVEPVSRVLAEEQRSHSEHRRVEVYRLFRVFRAGFESL